MSLTAQEKARTEARQVDSMETVRCGFCGNETMREATVDVLAGEEIGTWNKGDFEPHIMVAGIDAPLPEKEQWCVTCAENWFGVSKSAGERQIERVKTVLTASNIKSALAGAMFMFIVLLIL